MNLTVITLTLLVSLQSFGIFNAILLEYEISKKACSKTIEIKDWNDDPIKFVCLLSFNNEGHGLYAMVSTGKENRVYQIKPMVSETEDSIYTTSGEFIYVGTFNGTFHKDKHPYKVGNYILSNKGNGPKSYRAIELDTDLFIAKDFVSESVWIY